MVRVVPASAAGGSIDSSLFLGFFLFPSALVLSIYWTHSHLLHADLLHMVGMANTDALAKTLFQRGPPASIPQLTAHSPQLSDALSAGYHLTWDHTFPMQHVPGDWLKLASRFGSVQNTSGLHSLWSSLTDWLRLCQTCSAIHYVSFPFLLQGLIPNKHLHPKLHLCLLPENPS